MKKEDWVVIRRTSESYELDDDGTISSYWCEIYVGGEDYIHSDTYTYENWIEACERCDYLNSLPDRPVADDPDHADRMAACAEAGAPVSKDFLINKHLTPDTLDFDGREGEEKVSFLIEHELAHADARGYWESDESNHEAMRSLARQVLRASTTQGAYDELEREFVDEQEKVCELREEMYHLRKIGKRVQDERNKFAVELAQMNIDLRIARQENN